MGQGFEILAIDELHHDERMSFVVAEVEESADIRMGDLPAELHLPRRADPRTRVPAGSVAIAGIMTAIYPIESPGGWHLIGATPVRLFDPRWERPSLLAPGDAVRFEPITLDQYEATRADVAANRYTAPSAEMQE